MFQDCLRHAELHRTGSAAEERAQLRSGRLGDGMRHVSAYYIPDVGDVTSAACTCTSTTMCDDVL